LEKPVAVPEGWRKKWLLFLWDYTAGYAKPEVVVAVGRVAAVVAVRDTAVVRAAVPTAAPEHPVRARRSTTRISLRSRCISAIPVPAPLNHVARHVI